MDKEILELLRQMQKDNNEFRDELNNKLDNINDKLQAVYDQTADLTEFKQVK